MQIKKLAFLGMLILGLSAPNICKADDITRSVDLLDKTSISDTNTVISPLSLDLALGMIEEGSKGNTYSELSKYLGRDKAEMKKYSKAYLDNKSKELKVANSVWLTKAKDYKLNSTYNKLLDTNFGVKCQRVDFKDIKTATKINSWVKKNTDGMIPKLVNNIDESTKFMLINAVSFDCKWQDEFMGYDTSKAEFNGNIKTTVDFMHGNATTYIENKKATGFIKNYKNTRYKFVAILPKKKGEIKVSDLDVKGLMKTQKQTKVIVSMPKFKFETELDLRNILEQKYNMKNIFNANANFKGICNKPLYVNNIKQKAKIIVDEEGTKASVATMIEMTDGIALETEPPKIVNLNRPFVFMIYDSKTKSVLFLGEVNKVE